METLLVDLGERSYPIELGWNSLAELGAYLRRLIPAKKCLVVSNPVVIELYGQILLDGLKDAGFQPETFIISDSEQSKSIDTAVQVYDALVAHDFDRNSPILALGGGVVGDLAGFVAATYMRGVPFVQVPTTLLAQVDSSVGGKVGVNHREGKNLIGCFYQPRVVWIDLQTLTSLPRRELKAGMAEVVKYGVIQDEAFFRLLEAEGNQIMHLDKSILGRVVRHSCQIKAQIVGRDEREVGIRALLNYGHTFGHALETLTNYERYRHGEAVAVGMVIATKIALALAVCRDESVLDRQLALLNAFGLPAEWPADVDKAGILDVIMHDKKARGGSLRLVLPVRIGEMTIRRFTPEDVKLMLEHF
ncbi:MAG TPA: 3-dehydroquinate synthase [Clostridia bacterium]|nr:3-dehydroquinate synthase [Clostridia bacterium]